MHKNKINLSLNQIKRMYVDDDMTSREIANKLGCSSTTIEERLKEMNVNARNQAERNKHRMRHNQDWFARVKKGLNFKGEAINSAGYKLIYSPNHPLATKTKYVLEHRLVMEQEISRYLKSGEEVHHIDFNPLNNEPDNLHLFSDKGTHTGYHNMLREFIKDFLAEVI